MGLLILTPRQWTVRDWLRSIEHPGRPKGKPKGSWVAGDIVENRLSVLLCSDCCSGFDYKRHNYYPVSDKDDIYAGGRCESCRITSDKLFLYTPEEKLRQVIVTREEEREAARNATHIGG